MGLRVGLDTFTLHPYEWSDPMRVIEFAAAHELDGVQFGGIRHLSAGLDRGELRDIQAACEQRGLYHYASIRSPNPHAGRGTAADQLIALLREEIEAAADVGWRELHSVLGALDERIGHAVPWTRHLADSTAVLRELRPVLRDRGCRINLEDHGDTTTFELVRIAEEVGPDVVGICLDTANVLCNAEDPLWAIRRAAPYTHMTHAKDGIIYFTERGYTRQGRPPGRGVVPWREVLPILAHFEPDLALSIEDHKWVWEFAIFDPAWQRHFPDLTAAELGRVCRLAWETSQRIAQGELPDPVEYEKIAFKDELVDRLHVGRDFLRRTIVELSL